MEEYTKIQDKFRDLGTDDLIYFQFGPKLWAWIDCFAKDVGVKGGWWEMTEDQHQMVLRSLQNVINHIKMHAEDCGFELKDLDPNEE